MYAESLHAQLPAPTARPLLAPGSSTRRPMIAGHSHFPNGSNLTDTDRFRIPRVALAPDGHRPLSFPSSRPCSVPYPGHRGGSRWYLLSPAGAGGAKSASRKADAQPRWVCGTVTGSGRPERPATNAGRATPLRMRYTGKPLIKEPRATTDRLCLRRALDSL